MRAKRPESGWTRRAWLALAPAGIPLLAVAENGRAQPAPIRRYADPATEFTVELLTDPAQPSFLPYPYARFIAKGGYFFLFASDTGSGLQAFRFDLKESRMRQISEATALVPGSLNLLPGDKAFCYLDGRVLKLGPVSGARPREVYRMAEDWSPGEGFSVSGDGLYAALIEKRQGQSRLRLISLASGKASTLIEHSGLLAHPKPRPRRASVLYQRDDELWLVNYDGQRNQRLCTFNPSPGGAHWTPDGRSVLYLATENRRVTLREVTPDTRQDKLLAPTTQYANFAPNADGSVMIAASGSVASPYILALVRSVRRELTLCEHKASNPASVWPIFSPTSQRIYFQSDRHGGPAIYSVVVDKFIEKTES